MSAKRSLPRRSPCARPGGETLLQKGAEVETGNEENTTIYAVVVNQEEQYSIWPADREVPAGWRAVGKSGLKAECLDFIKEVWTDMRPLSLQKKRQA